MKEDDDDDNDDEILANGKMNKEKPCNNISG